ncbi:hypothetical protein [Oceanobacillus sp. J11TS1]|uniref:hypothetical protein n=1 Tax=Oceanobacillus sp. J11TS1 TaxID=2807191 RepID=UPI001AFF6375|nr:hypothetical protein [Oceanobacillus sp. J11TS1]GIO22483.1 hypothetical protein J11TS1_10640 [Oceanobacillus sp. J11TS1]
MTVRNEDLFYCYSRKLSDYIYEKSDPKIVPLTIAINPKSGRTFSLYSKSASLQVVLDQYKREN